MKQITQKIISYINGDCFGACIGSILEIENYPNFHTDDTGDWIYKWDKWLHQHGFGLFYATFGSLRLPDGYSIISVASSLYPDKTHAIVRYKDINGKVTIWNPNPVDKRGNEIPLSDYKIIYVLYILDPTKANQQYQQKIWNYDYN